MSNSPNSLESQIDNFIEHFKRSASNALDDWGQSKNSDSVQDANSNCSGRKHFSNSLYTNVNTYFNYLKCSF